MQQYCINNNFWRRKMEYPAENFKIPNYPNRMEIVLDFHKEIGTAKEQIMIDVLLELITLIGDDNSVSQTIKDRINKRYDELENSRQYKPHG
jgi:hypothetical protein